MSLALLGVACTTEPQIESSSTDTEAADESPAVSYRTVEVINTYPHDPSLFTQGLEFVDDMLIESAGGRGRSSIRIYDPTNGSVVATHDLDGDLFAEGATVVGDRIWQLTWTSERALVYLLDGLELVDEVQYEGEGWGLCLLDDQFVMSNGSDQLTLRRTTDFAAVESIPVRLEGFGPVSALNELECVSDGGRSMVWANVWRSTTIYGVDAATGRVTEVVDASALVPPGFEDDTEQVLNGIAIHPETGRLWLTGKEWPVLYEVEISGG